MEFSDPSIPIPTCHASSCAGCDVAESIHCHFGREDLFHFYLICMPGFLVGGAGILSFGLAPLVLWIGILLAFFGFVEIRVMCSHCPHYAEEGSTLRCWANYGSPKLWRYRPGPMSTAENYAFFAGLAVVWGYPMGFLLTGGLWFLLTLYVLVNAAFLVTLKRFLCSRCMNFACPLNGVPEPVRAAFFERNPGVARAWEVGP